MFIHTYIHGKKKTSFLQFQLLMEPGTAELSSFSCGDHHLCLPCQIILMIWQKRRIEKSGLEEKQ